jgi:putative transposase
VGVADITHIPTWASFLCLTVVLDALKIVGWAMETHLRTELVLAALNMASGNAAPPGDSSHRPGLPIHLVCLRRTLRRGRRAAIDGLGGRLFRQRHVREFFATLECELLDRTSFKAQAEARMAVFDFIRAGITLIVGTPLSTTSRPSITNECTLQNPSHEYSTRSRTDDEKVND